MMDISPIGLLIIQGGEIIYSNNEAIGLLEKENITLLLSTFEDFISKLEIVNKTKTTCTLKSTSGLYLYYQEKSITFNQVISKLVILNNLTQLFETEQLKTNQRFAEMLISTSTHELRTPLHCIKAVLSENINAVNSQQITKALNACDIQEQCINDILDYAKIKNNSIIINKDTFDIIEFLNEIKYFFIDEFNAKGLYLQLDTLGLSRRIVELDKRRLKQVMFNLISNALKFTFTKGVTIRSFDVNKKLCIQVEDSGIGIEPVDMEKLFTPFGMIKSSSQYNKTGTGLGLYLSQTFCHLMDGHIYSYSVPKVGTTFTICFNIDCLKFGHILNIKSNSIIIEHSFWYTGRLKALIVDDNPFNCEVLEAMLKKLNIISYKAYSGNDALRIVHNCADIFIGFFDINMPIMDGFTLMSEIFKLYKEMSVNNFPVFAITGDNSEGLQMKCGEIGFKGFISKPFSAKKISEILHWLYPN
jgi:signal transduction histidine kinase